LENVECNEKFYIFLQALQKIGNEYYRDDYDFLTLCDISELINDSSDVADRCPRETIFGYPTRPLYRELGSMLQMWFHSG